MKTKFLMLGKLQTTALIPLALTVACLLFSDVAFSSDNNLESSPLVHHYFMKGKHEHAAKWGYRGKNGPKFWGKLSPKYRIAIDGKRQSPIDIKSNQAITSNLPPLKFSYREERISAFNNGHTIQHNEQPGSFLHVGNKVYSLEQFHAHVPSEHTIDGLHADMEIHFVHKSKEGKVAVVAILANASEKKMEARRSLYKELPRQLNEVVEAKNIDGNPMDLIPGNHEYFTYDGSFTTPPCTQGIQWIIIKTPVVISPQVLLEFQQAMGKNNRPLQQLHGREIRFQNMPNEN